jgi:hypothetical protein
MGETESMHRRPMRGGTEVDAFSRSSQHALAWRPGERARIKDIHNHRVRRGMRQELRDLRGRRWE